MTYRKKLIEVALPLEVINAESAREKSIRHGHPSTLHLWFARRPLAACRAVIFASLVDDPSAHPDQFPTKEMQESERRRLFSIIEQLVKWENSKNPTVLSAARREIEHSTGGHIPPLLDPFCGGGSIPLEAQRLGLEAHGSDLNPIPVLITRALVEIPPKFANQAPANPDSRRRVGGASGWLDAHGLAEDVRYYGGWIRDEARKQVGNLYPKVQLPQEKGGGEATIIAWLWTRTVTCPNPACHIKMPLARSFALSTKPDKRTWVEPVVDRATKAVRFEVRKGQGPLPAGTVNRLGATCINCGTPVPLSYVRAEGSAHRMLQQMMAVVAEGQRGRIYLNPSDDQISIADQARPTWQPDCELPKKHRNFQTPGYGMSNVGDLFTPRQLVVLNTLSQLVDAVREQVCRDASVAGMPDDGISLADGGEGATAYGDAVATYLAFAVDRSVDRGSTICSWDSSPKMEALRNTFARQAIPMTWDFAEGNPFSASSGNWMNNVEWTAMVIDNLAPAMPGWAIQLDATAAIENVTHPLISTDPPYYDNINYADLSDFFYVWLRRSLNKVYPALFSTMLTPKTQELIAAPHRFDGDRTKAQLFFEEGLGKSFAQMRAAQHPNFPLTVYYAFKQAEVDDDKLATGSGATTASTGWETMLEGLLKAGFSITGTWPMRTELSNRMVASGANALASSIVLVCRPRPVEAPRTTRRDFLNALKRELPDALKNLQHGNIAPVDLAQATIGPGMVVFSRYSKVIEANGVAMGVRTALQLINQALDEVLTEQEGEFDADTRWAITWFEQFGAGEGLYGVAETLSKAKNTSVAGLVEAGLLVAKGGKVRLLRRDELPTDWNPSTDKRLTVWETAQHLIRALERDGENGAASILAKLGERGQIARDLAYRLYTLCERKGWAEEALAYNSLVIAWQGIGQLASQQAVATSAPRQQEMFT